VDKIYVSYAKLNKIIRYDTLRYDTIAEFNVDSKAEYTA